MMEDRILMIFALVWLCYSGAHGQMDTNLPCDDKRVENAVNVTLSAYNSQSTEGAQLALYQILEATKAQNQSAEVISVRFSVRSTDCPVGGDKVWQECNYLQQRNKASRIRIECRAKVLFTEDSHEILSNDCSAILTAKAPVEPRVRSCAGCPKQIDVNSEVLKEPLNHSLAKANSVVNHTHFFIFKNLTSATKQVVAGFKFKLQFDMEKSNCTKSEFKAVTDECHPVKENREFLQCNSTVIDAPWMYTTPNVHVECARRSVSRVKRPPGWSPLRTVELQASSPTTKPKESSEESQETRTAAQNTQLNCPSKPWKKLNPKPDSPPPTVSTQPDSTTTGLALDELDLWR